MNELSEQPCYSAIVAAIEVISGKWSYSVISQLCQGAQRFNQLHRSLAGISIKSLTDTLRHLEQRGIIARKVFPTVPVTVEYSLTESGMAYSEVLVRMREWGINWGVKSL
ncbi:transcriptional regulator, HxlR family [Paenibacillus curdlanolyticus YK9]|uniref:Transcriptional regulator, HxlR family n=1 Tax=Paenibacillus curdlanolyticus YK9 TaxID=717606 RepID=E0I8S5_9BACL|nr:helix-turn-helix domain-containing protein [Paenibacillus curdlanolyticus]EFM10809.1 transcriptional regulator, HxlR family [Paenibacillus curdlanolyticus YK9]